MIHALVSFLLLGLGQAEARDCDDSLQRLADERLSVAWVSPVGGRAMKHQQLSVVSTTALRQWIDRESTEPGRLLQALGLQKKSTTPRRDYMITLFEVTPEQMCRPVLDEEPGALVEGMVVCDNPFKAMPRHYKGCGYHTVAGTDDRTLDAYRVIWSDAASQGFVVLPLERFISGR